MRWSLQVIWCVTLACNTGTLRQIVGSKTNYEGKAAQRCLYEFVFDSSTQNTDCPLAARVRENDTSAKTSCVIMFSFLFNIILD